MNRLFTDLGYKMQRFMMGRYGDDALNRCLMSLGVICLIISMFPRMGFIYLGVLFFFGLSLFRTLSKNGYKRSRENSVYLKFTDGIRKKFYLVKSMYRDRKTHEYYKCPNCKTYVRIAKPPKGKTIAVRCNKCRNEFTKRT